MKTLINQLEAIRQTCKEWHYEARGDSFYASHQLADRIADPLNGFIDSIKEICFLGNETLPPSEFELEPPTELYDMITVSIYWVEQAVTGGGLKQGELNLLGGISEHLMLSRGLLWRTLQRGES